MSSSSDVLSLRLFMPFMGFLRQEYWDRLPFPSLVDHILSEVSTMTHRFWVAMMAWLIASLSYISPSTKSLHEEVSCNHLCVIFVHVCVAGQWAAVYGVARSRTQLSDFTFPFHFHALEKEMATHSSVLAWRWGSLVGCHLWGHTESNMTEVT